MKQRTKVVGALAVGATLAPAVLLGGGPVLRWVGLAEEVGGLPAEPVQANFTGVGKAPARGAVPGEVLVRFEPDTDAQERADARETVDAALEDTLPLPRLQHLELTGDTPVQAAVEELEDDPAVAYAEPNFYRRVAASTSDPYFQYLWGLENTGQTVKGMPGLADADADVPEAWDTTTGSAEVTTAVVDTGVDMAHPDLTSKIWRNPGETGSGKESNGKDDDGNGLVDDWRGWDWAAGDNDPADVNGHGTHVSGTIAASADDKGIVGVNRGGTVMPLRVLGDDGYGTVANLVKAYQYAGLQGAQILNASLGGQSASRTEYDAIKAAPNTLFVVAAGNGGADGIGDDNDLTPQYPCSYDLSNIVCVAATNQLDALATFSNYGAKSVDLAAPGTNILSDYPGSRYAYFDGTSMATPHVAGVAGLVWAQRPGATPLEVKQAVLDGAEPKVSLTGRTLTGGRLNAQTALASGQAPAAAPANEAPKASPPAEALVPGSQARDADVPVRLSWSGTDDQTPAKSLEYQLARLVDGTWQSAPRWTTQTSSTGPMAFGTSSRFRVRARDEAGKESAWATASPFTPRAYQESGRAIDYRGKWRRIAQSTALGGAVRSSRTAGNRATFRFKARDVGVVMPRRRTLGTAKVCLDPGTTARSCKTVDLSPSSGLGARRLVFTRSFNAVSSHSVRVEVVRGRVDLDAFVLLR